MTSSSCRSHFWNLVLRLSISLLTGNRLQTLPESIGELSRLTFLDVQSNQLKRLPEALGCLTNLTTLSIQKNYIEELPWTIGLCTSLVEFNADFNQLKALPEAIGHLKSLQRLSVHLNSLKSLPTTISSLTNLTDLDVHFNHLESIPQSLCFLPHLRRLDVSSNFTELQELPNSIGHLQSLQDLNISFNHIMVLPDSFGMLTGLQKLTLDGNPWRIPPQEVAQQGKEVIYPSTFVHSSGSLYGEFESLMFFSVFGSQVVCLISEILTTAKSYYPYFEWFMDTKQTSIWVEIYLFYSSFAHLSKLNYCWACFFVGWCARYDMTDVVIELYLSGIANMVTCRLYWSSWIT